MAIVFYRVVVGILDRSSRLPTLAVPDAAAAASAVDGGIKFKRT